MDHSSSPTFLDLVMREGATFVAPRSLEELVAFRDVLDMSRLNSDPPPDVSINAGVVLCEKRGSALTAEVYLPDGGTDLPVLLYMHGGGWCLEDAASVRKLCMQISSRGFCVVNLNYSLAPEHPFPRAVEDCVYAVKWIHRNIEYYGGSSRWLALSGDSAGANLAAATIVALNGTFDELDLGDMADAPWVVSAALLFYGAYDFPLALQEPGVLGGFVEVQWHQAYLGSHFLSRNRHPLVSPVYADDLGSFPPTYLTCGAHDWTLRHTLNFGAALAEAGAVTRISVVPGVAHFFAQMADYFIDAEQEMDRIYDWLHAQSTKDG